MTEAQPMSRYARIRTDRAFLAEKYPGCFMPNGFAVKKPLARGILSYLLDDKPADAFGALTNTRIRNALHDYVRGAKYLVALVSGGPRYGLDGNPEGYVTTFESRHALIDLTTNHAIWIQRNNFTPPERLAA